MTSSTRWRPKASGSSPFLPMNPATRRRLRRARGCLAGSCRSSPWTPKPARLRSPRVGRSRCPPGLAGLAVIVFIGIAAGQSIRRHLKLAALKTDLVAAASHELRTPVTAIGVLVDGLRTDQQLEPRKTREYLDMMASETSRLQRLIDSFLTFAQLDQGRQQFTLTPVQPSWLVEKAVDAIRDRLPADCRLDLDIVPGLPMVIADADALGTALVNLAGERARNTPPATSASACGRPRMAAGSSASTSPTTASVSLQVSSGGSSGGSIASINGCRARPPASASASASSN